MKWIEIIKEYYPAIVLNIILFFLLIDFDDYQVLIVFSNVFGFSLTTNHLIKNHYKNNIISKNSIDGLMIVNIINIIGCFLEYDNYLKILLIATIILSLLTTSYKQWTKK
jgi:hypothetical protein